MVSVAEIDVHRVGHKVAGSICKISVCTGTLRYPCQEHRTASYRFVSDQVIASAMAALNRKKK